MSFLTHALGGLGKLGKHMGGSVGRGISHGASSASRGVSAYQQARSEGKGVWGSLKNGAVGFAKEALFGSGAQGVANDFGAGGALNFGQSFAKGMGFGPG